jgi:hypothetical protein
MNDALTTARAVDLPWQQSRTGVHERVPSALNPCLSRARYRPTDRGDRPGPKSDRGTDTDRDSRWAVRPNGRKTEE